MKRILPILLALLMSGCTAANPASVPAEPASPTPAATAAPTPEPTPEVYKASIGVIGDILMMTSQISTAKQEDGSYDFTDSFRVMQPLFESVDVMAGNFEGTLAGEEAGYTQKRPEAPPPTADNPNPKQPFQTFNAPDELADNLKAVGFDLLTTANNHAVDRGIEGLFRTIDVIKAAGILQTGTFKAEADRYTPCIFAANGITFGAVAATASLNRHDAKLGDSTWAAARLYDEPERLEREIALCREAGADVVLVFPHWGEQYTDRPNSKQRETAQWLADCGADAVIGSHPHCAQPFEWIVSADGRRVFVAYSMSNFISNMSIENTEYGLFLRLDVEKTPDGITMEASYLPTVCVRQKLSDGRRLHQALPCWEDESRITGLEPLDEGDMRKARRAFEHVTDICGHEAAKLIDWNEEYDKQA
ncbi:MAG: CapA family protein [Clostridia bacterium]|nr:CapA family protein [Clostridia bacterium]